MKISELPNCPQWLLDAYTKDADVEWSAQRTLLWNSGAFLGGAFWGGEFWGDAFLGGEFRGGEFRGGAFLGGEFWGDAFRGGEFRGGAFWGEKLSRNPLLLRGLKWHVTITDNQMEIGCERHLISEWRTFDNATINRMDRHALKFWLAHKAVLLALCEARGPTAA